MQLLNPTGKWSIFSPLSREIEKLIDERDSHAKAGHEQTVADLDRDIKRRLAEAMSEEYESRVLPLEIAYGELYGELPPRPDSKPAPCFGLDDDIVVACADSIGPDGSINGGQLFKRGEK